MKTITPREVAWSEVLTTLHTDTREGPQEADFNASLWNSVADAGLFRVLHEHGTGSSGFKVLMQMVREMGRCSGDRGLTFSAVTRLASTIYCLRAFGGNDLAKEYLTAAENGSAIGAHAITESHAGSDVMAMTTAAVLDTSQGVYTLNGTKQFITNGPVASMIIVYAKTIVDGVDIGISPFLVETSWEGVDASQRMRTAGLSSSPIGVVKLNDVRVPLRNRIGPSGAGMLILDQVMKREILLAFSANIGEMEAGVTDSVKYVNARHQFGSPIGSNQLVAGRLVDSQIAIELGWGLLSSIVDRIDGFEDLTVAISAAKIFISEQNLNASINEMRVQGGRGYLQESFTPARVMDAIPGAIYSGSNDVLRSKIATLMGVSAK